MLDDATSHHDGLEILPVDGPELDVGQRWKTAQTTQRTVQLTGNVSQGYSGVAEFAWRERCADLGSRVYKRAPYFSFSKEYLCC